MHEDTPPPPPPSLSPETIKDHVRDYRARRAATGHEEAEVWRKALLNGGRHIGYLVLPPAVLMNVRLNFGLFAARYEDLMPWERKNVEAVLKERIESVVLDEPKDTHLSHTAVVKYRIK